MIEKEVGETISMLRYAADQLVEVQEQLQSKRNDGCVREYYRETIARLQESLCIQLDRIPLGDGSSLEQLDMFGKEND